jgi:Arc/MetJ-type ribon-helix-helix transcriptional regulator
MTSQPITITLPQPYADAVRQRVSSGQYDNEIDVVISALQLLDHEEAPHEGQEFESWLRETVVPIAIRKEANPESGYTAEQVLAHIRQDMREFDEHPDVA